jgi:hypothetical protein
MFPALSNAFFTSCGVLATAVKPDANGPSSSLKTGTLRPTVVRRAAAKVVPGRRVLCMLARTRAKNELHG